MNKRSVDDNFARQACVYGASCYMKVHLFMLLSMCKEYKHLLIHAPIMNTTYLEGQINKNTFFYRILSIFTSFNTPEKTPHS